MKLGLPGKRVDVLPLTENGESVIEQNESELFRDSRREST